ncbi:LytTR family DNA-binding domain-containing protein [Liquorilactobacillus mali]|uniref:Transcriptional regulator n=1 Tax=Liquorilactobacillus mali KCTC 3596 = DSM 20444 TaxID=1046596 RepID=J0L5G3_9LACO|nr:LytTR family DNA-binding domain-containing protein [Liquorilactobacillus mali]EJE99326.1 putative transcriptional regulator [Liquorilactobacillus mali KCTC 3596 = DSM 20444]KRN10420.1 transcriptional regulator [Liquorilactobacillus mali KCTC 3596 = DSM 20444]MDC7952663.1 LytTR family transcriptional regulator [Liquorilactobacillus mali]MDV7758102.1 LytTR family transcriptional regulator [Liquorilactobacillus mali]QFQ74645.1 LytTR family transcriptional regulator [Liquorilactobacillus mali]
MNVRFEQDDTLQDEIDVVVKASRQSDETSTLMEYIKRAGQESSKIVPVKTADRIIIVKVEDIILADVQKDTLTIETVTDQYVLQERLYKFMQKLPNEVFVQVSKHAVINIDYLIALEDSFAGAMIARLEKNLRTSVSRKFLVDLERHLGL